MKNKIHLLGTALLIGGLTLAVTTQAQRQPGQGRPGGGRTNPYSQLGLTEKQQAAVKALQEKQRAETRKIIEALRGGGGDRQAATAKLRETSAKFQKQIEALLTDAQKKKLAELRAQRPDRRPGGRPGQGGGRRNPYEALKLTEEQQKKVTAISTEQRAEMTKMFQDLRAKGGGFEGVREKMTALRAKYDKKIEALLTDEQKKKFKELRSNRGRRPGGDGRPRPEGKDRPRPKRSDA